MGMCITPGVIRSIFLTVSLSLAVDPSKKRWRWPSVDRLVSVEPFARTLTIYLSTYTLFDSTNCGDAYVHASVDVGIFSCNDMPPVRLHATGWANNNLLSTGLAMTYSDVIVFEIFQSRNTLENLSLKGQFIECHISVKMHYHLHFLEWLSYAYDVHVTARKSKFRLYTNNARQGFVTNISLWQNVDTTHNYSHQCPLMLMLVLRILS